MTFLSNLHTHTIFCDGLNTVEDMVVAAMELGFQSIGFSSHGPADYDDAAMPRQSVPQYFDAISAARDKYGNQIEIYTGMESDAFSLFDKSRLDYSLAGAHHVEDGFGRIHCIDYLDIQYQEAAHALGGYQQLVEKYYDTLSKMILSYRPDIIGHIDIITKLNKGFRYFDPESGWYKRLEENIAEIAAASGCITEVNTAGIFNACGYPYPSKRILSALYELGAPVTLSSDTHQAAHLNRGFDDALKMLCHIGFKSVKQLKDGKFIDVEIR